MYLSKYVILEAALLIPARKFGCFKSLRNELRTNVMSFCHLLATQNQFYVLLPYACNSHAQKRLIKNRTEITKHSE